MSSSRLSLLALCSAALGAACASTTPKSAWEATSQCKASRFEAEACDALLDGAYYSQVNDADERETAKWTVELLERFCAADNDGRTSLVVADAQDRAGLSAPEIPEWAHDPSTLTYLGARACLRAGATRIGVVLSPSSRSIGRRTAARSEVLRMDAGEADLARACGSLEALRATFKADDATRLWPARTGCILLGDLYRQSDREEPGRKAYATVCAAPAAEACTPDLEVPTPDHAERAACCRLAPGNRLTALGSGWVSPEETFRREAEAVSRELADKASRKLEAGAAHGPREALEAIEEVVRTGTADDPLVRARIDTALDGAFAAASEGGRDLRIRPQDVSAVELTCGWPTALAKTAAFRRAASEHHLRLAEAQGAPPALAMFHTRVAAAYGRGDLAPRAASMLAALRPISLTLQGAPAGCDFLRAEGSASAPFQVALENASCRSDSRVTEREEPYTYQEMGTVQTTRATTEGETTRRVCTSVPSTFSCTGTASSSCYTLYSTTVCHDEVTSSGRTIYIPSTERQLVTKTATRAVTQRDTSLEVSADVVIRRGADKRRLPFRSSRTVTETAYQTPHGSQALSPSATAGPESEARAALELLLDQQLGPERQALAAAALEAARAAEAAGRAAEAEDAFLRAMIFAGRVDAHAAEWMGQRYGIDATTLAGFVQ